MHLSIDPALTTAAVPSFIWLFDVSAFANLYPVRTQSEHCNNPSEMPIFGL